MAWVSDFGGHNHRNGGRQSVKLKASTGNLNGTVSTKCADCGKRQHPSLHMMLRKVPPRCTKCGGMLLETELSKKRRGIILDKMPIPKYGTEGIRCRSCGEKLVMKEGFKIHFYFKPECKEYYKANPEK